MEVKSPKLLVKENNVYMAYLTILSILLFHDFGQFSEKFGPGLKRAGWVGAVRCLGTFLNAEIE